MKSCSSLLTLLVLAGPVGAVEIDKQLLRQLAEMPTVSVSAEFGFSTNFGFYFNGMKPDPLAEIARIRKELKGDDSDAERYLRLGELYAKVDRKKGSEAAYAKAVAMCRQQVKEHPDDMSWLARLGDALVHSGKIEEGEALLRRAVKQGPKEWRAWVALGQCVDARAFRAILGDTLGDTKITSFHVLHDKFIKSPFFSKKPSAEQIAEWQRLRQEAHRCYDRAIKLAPWEMKPYLWRVGSRFAHEIVEAGLHAVRGKPADNLKAAIFTSACAADTREIAKLSGEDPKTVGMAVLVELMVCILHDKLAAPFLTNEARSLVDLLPEDSRDFVRWGMKRLEQLTKSDEKSTAADASEILTYILLVINMVYDDDERPEFLHDSAKEAVPQIADHLRRVVRLDPRRERAWDVLTALLARKERVAEAVAVCKQRIKINDNAHSRFMLAKCYAEIQQYDKAADQLQLGIKKDENDLNCHLGLIAALLQRDDAEALREAGDQLDAVAPLLKQQKSKSSRAHYLLLSGLHAALNDHPEQAKELLKQVLQRDDKNKAARKVLFVLGERMGPAREREAIKLIRRCRGKIRRQHGRSDAPVVEVDFSDAKITDEDLLVLTAFPHLRTLKLSAAPITDDALEYLEPLKQLRHLTLPEKITDAGLAHLASIESLTRLSLSGTKFTDAGLAHLTRLQQLRVLHLGGTNVSDAGLIHLKGLTQLRELSLENTKITDKGLAHLTPLTELRVLKLDRTKITDAGMADLEAFSHLERLTLPEKQIYPWDKDQKQPITDVGLAHLRNLGNLRDVSLTGSLTDKGLAHLAALPQLQKLYVIHSKLTDEGMKHFERCTELKELWLAGTEIGDAGVAHLKGLHQLRELSLGNTKITGAGLAHLKELTNLEYLDLADTSITDAGLAHLRGLTRLRELNLSEFFARVNRELEMMSFFPGQEKKPAKKPNKPQITDAGLEHLQDLTALEHLNLLGRPLTGSGLGYLKRLTNLHHLFLNSPRITDAALCHLEQFPSLEWLCLSNADITDAGLTHLHKLKHLQSVRLGGTKVTDKGVAELRKVFPKIEISR